MTSEGLPPVLLVGAGRMGGALFGGWVARGLAPSALVDPAPTPGIGRPGDIVAAVAADLPRDFVPAAVVLAVKPQMADEAMPALAAVLPPGCVVLSIMAGRRIAGIAASIGGRHAVVRAMPNTPASIGRGITVACAGPGGTGAQRDLCDRLLAAVGEVAWVQDEALIDPVTAVSGSGPAYVFLLAELLEQAGIAEGLPAELARLLARKTISGAGALLDASPEDAASLRRAVTSPRGTTEAALAVLMDEAAWPHSVEAAVRAATNRARELAS
ncbi:MAG: pyrroline-5-carboxylate reductase [Rhodospirillales bacterium]